MSTYNVEFQRSAKKELDRLDAAVRARILRKLVELSDNPRPPGVTRLAGQGQLWRVRVGDYRVVYTIEDGHLVVVIVRIAARGKVYRNM